MYIVCLCMWACLCTVHATLPCSTNQSERVLVGLDAKCGFVVTPYLEGHGDLVTGLIMGIIGVIIWLIGFINLRTKSTLQVLEQHV